MNEYILAWVTLIVIGSALWVLIIGPIVFNSRSLSYKDAVKETALFTLIFGGALAAAYAIFLLVSWSLTVISRG